MFVAVMEDKPENTGKEFVMGKKSKEDLEILKKLNTAEHDLLGGIYGDLFGSGIKPENVPDPGADSESCFPGMPDIPEAPRVSESEALKNAEDALKEAHKLLDELTTFGDNMAPKITEGIASLFGGGKKEDGIAPDMPPVENPVAGSSPDGQPVNADAGTAADKPAKGEMDASGSSGEVKTGQEQPSEVAAGGPAVQAETAVQAKAEEPEEDPMEKLDSLIGLTTIKHDVKELTDFVRIQKMRKDEGLKSVPVSLHLVFTGNPGTGKTTVARILSSIYKKMGVLSKGQLVEVDRSGLVAGYVGQTAIKTQERIQEALGGVLFIDEAYSLAQKDDAFGQECIDTILKAMEDHRDDLVVIVAGYTKPMEKFINSNPGLKSRFNKYIEFPDYTVDELEGIFNMNCKKYDYTVEEEAAFQIREMIKHRKFTKLENFANAREVRNMFEEIITNHARRIAAMENPTHEDMVTLTTYDLIDEEEKKIKEDAAQDEIKTVQEALKAAGLEIPSAEEPAAEEPAAEETVTEESTAEEPAVEEPAAEEPAAEEPETEEPAAEETTVEEPAVEEPAAEEESF